MITRLTLPHATHALAALTALNARAATENLLRNGSFEGGLLYWHQAKAPEQTLVKDAKAGESVPHCARENERFLRTAGLTFVAPQAGTFALHGKASAHLWESKNKTTLHLLKKTAATVEKVGALISPPSGEGCARRPDPLSLRKRDAQRAAEVSVIQLPRDGTPVAINVGVELTSGHELLFVPMMQGLYNNAANLTIEGLNIIPVSGP